MKEIIKKVLLEYKKYKNQNAEYCNLTITGTENKSIEVKNG
jgi:hypothetical protein